MIHVSKELTRLSRTLVVRGALMLVLGVAAVMWPEPALIGAMLTVGIVASVFGIYEMSIGVSLRGRTPEWSVILAHGTASLAFGLLTVGAPGLTLRLALVVTAAWFVLYTAISWKAAIDWWSIPTLRSALLIWGGIDAALGLLAVAYPAATIFALLFFGAVYAALFGAWQIAMGFLIRQLMCRGSIAHAAAPAGAHA